MKVIVISACLIGELCRYDGKQVNYHELDFLMSDPNVTLLPVCPEVLGGLQTPRPPCEIRGDRVITRNGEDVTEAFREGAEKVLTVCQASGAELAILKANSPSCGSGRIYDGSFSHTLIPGDGICASLLKKNGIKVFCEKDIERIKKHVRKNA